MSSADVSSSACEEACGASVLNPSLTGCEAFEAADRGNPEKRPVQQSEASSSPACKCSEEYRWPRTASESWSFWGGGRAVGASGVFSSQQRASAVFEGEASRPFDLSPPESLKGLPESLAPHAAPFLLATLRSAATAASRIVQTLATDGGEGLGCEHSVSALAVSAQVSRRQSPGLLSADDPNDECTSEESAEAGEVHPGQREATSSECPSFPFAGLASAEELRRWEVEVYRSLIELFFNPMRSRVGSPRPLASRKAPASPDGCDGADPPRPLLPPPSQAEAKPSPRSVSKSASTVHTPRRMLVEHCVESRNNRPLNPNAPPFIPRSSTRNECAASPTDFRRHPASSSDLQEASHKSPEGRVQPPAALSSPPRRPSEADAFEPSVHPALRGDAAPSECVTKGNSSLSSFGLSEAPCVVGCRRGPVKATAPPQKSLLQLRRALQILHALRQQSLSEKTCLARAPGEESLGTCSTVAVSLLDSQVSQDEPLGFAEAAFFRTPAAPFPSARPRPRSLAFSKRRRAASESFFERERRRGDSSGLRGRSCQRLQQQRLSRKEGPSSDLGAECARRRLPAAAAQGEGCGECRSLFSEKVKTLNAKRTALLAPSRVASAPPSAACSRRASRDFLPLASEAFVPRRSRSASIRRLRRAKKASAASPGREGGVWDISTRWGSCSCVSSSACLSATGTAGGCCASLCSFPNAEHNQSLPSCCGSSTLLLSSQPSFEPSGAEGEASLEAESSSLSSALPTAASEVSVCPSSAEALPRSTRYSLCEMLKARSSAFSSPEETEAARRLLGFFSGPVLRGDCSSGVPLLLPQASEAGVQRRAFLSADSSDSPPPAPQPPLASAAGNKSLGPWPSRGFPFFNSCDGRSARPCRFVPAAQQPRLAPSPSLSCTEPLLPLPQSLPPLLPTPPSQTAFAKAPPPSFSRRKRQPPSVPQGAAAVLPVAKEPTARSPLREPALPAAVSEESCTQRRRVEGAESSSAGAASSPLAQPLRYGLACQAERRRVAVEMVALALDRLRRQAVHAKKRGRKAPPAACDSLSNLLKNPNSRLAGAGSRSRHFSETPTQTQTPNEGQGPEAALRNWPSLQSALASPPPPAVPRNFESFTPPSDLAGKQTRTKTNCHVATAERLSHAAVKALDAPSPSSAFHERQEGQRGPERKRPPLPTQIPGLCGRCPYTPSLGEQQLPVWWGGAKASAFKQEPAEFASRNSRPKSRLAEEELCRQGSPLKTEGNSPRRRSVPAASEGSALRKEWIPHLQGNASLGRPNAEAEATAGLVEQNGAPLRASPSPHALFEAAAFVLAKMTRSGEGASQSSKRGGQEEAGRAALLRDLLNQLQARRLAATPKPHLR